MVILPVNIKPSRKRKLLILNPKPYFRKKNNPSRKELAFLFQERRRNHHGEDCSVGSKI